MRIPALTIIGPPGAGKGTQARLLANYDAVHHFSTGDAFRAQKDSPLAKRYSETLRSGAFFPDEIAMRLLGQEIVSQDYAIQDLLVIDGAPRTPRQVHLLEELVDVRHVIALDSDDNSLLAERLWHRDERAYDRNAVQVQQRLDDYVHKTRPVLDEYLLLGRVVSRVRLDQSIPVVHAEIMCSLQENLLVNKWFKH